MLQNTGKQQNATVKRYHVQLLQHADDQHKKKLKKKWGNREGGFVRDGLG